MKARLLSANGMARLEAAAVADGRADWATLMERAGRGAVDAIFSFWPDLAHGSREAFILCGPGGNGGDGFAVARLLRERGWSVRVFAMRQPADVPAHMRSMRQAWEALGPVEDLAAAASVPGADKSAPSLCVDGLFGGGLRRPLPAEAAAAMARLGSDRRRVALDAPSGVCLDTGRVIGECVPVHLTVSFHALKLGHCVGAGPAYCGAVRIAGIGLDDTACSGRDVNCGAELVDKPALRTRGIDGHKYDHGHVIVVAGPAGRGGAARLAARAALRAGAGLVTVAPPGDAMIEHAARLDAVMLRRCDDAADLAAIAAGKGLIVLALGPALGVDDRAHALLRAADRAATPRVLDADALTLLAATGPATEKTSLTAGPVVLTPHFGEFRRLASALPGPVDYQDKPAAVRAVARAYGAVVVLKGPDTLIAAPDGRLAVHAAFARKAAPWLATAGSGDVLAGIVGAFMAQGETPFDAAQIAVWLHAAAGRTVGPGLIAEDLSEALPAVIAGS